MAWLKLDDALIGGKKLPKLLRRPGRKVSGLEAFGVWTAAALHCARDLTDGQIDPEWLEDLLDDAKVAERRRVDLLDVLVEKQWFDRHPDGSLWVHDYLDHNPSRAEVEAAREVARNKKRKQRAKEPGLSPGDTPGTDLETPPGLPGAVLAGAPAARPVPHPNPQINPEERIATPTQPGPVDVDHRVRQVA